MTYLPRILDRELASALTSSGAVLIEGPKACGKTETAVQVAASAVRLDVDDDARELAAIDPSILLRGETPRLLDEWQVEPAIWNHVRRAVDDRSPARGQFILTGSATPNDDVHRHSGAGRFATLRMRPMSLFESGHSSGVMSLADLLEGGEASSTRTALTIDDVLERIVVGGWPDRQRQPVEIASLEAQNYLAQIAEVDISQVEGTRRDPSHVLRLISSIARNVATEAPMTKIAADVDGAEGPIHRTTATDLKRALERLRLVEEQPAWAPHLRSRIPARTSPKHHLVDPSLAAAALNAGPERLLKDMNWTGFLFESLVVRDLRVYAQPLRGRVFHFRDAKGLEADAVVQLQDGRWAAFEVKMGASRIDEGAASLLRFAERVDSSKSGMATALGVITATGFGYRRPDGVHVIPIGALGP